jgi:hypothetical protein
MFGLGDVRTHQDIASRNGERVPNRMTSTVLDRRSRAARRTAKSPRVGLSPPTDGTAFLQAAPGLVIVAGRASRVKIRLGTTDERV